jgi:hypothetical protein
MSLSPSNPVYGAAMTGYTSPTFTLTEDSVQSANVAKQWAITAFGGTVPSEANTHSISNPFTVTVERPANFRGVGQPNPTTGYLGQQPRNVWKVRIRKGLIPLTGQAAQTAPLEIRIPVPAGTDVADPENIRALMSFTGGFLSGNASALAQALIDGII